MDWLRGNWLKLNLSKIKVIWLGQHEPLGSIEFLALDGVLLTLLDYIRSLKVRLDKVSNIA